VTARRGHVAAGAVLLCLVLPAALPAQRCAAPSRCALLPRVRVNDNRVAAGRRVGDTTQVTLVARLARWYPEADDGPAVQIQAFAAGSAAPSIPGPLIRVPEGRPLRVTVRNALARDTLVVHGLLTRPGTRGTPLVVPPGAARTVRFAAGAPGSYFYYATTTHQPDTDREGRDSQLSGAFIVDSAGAPPAPDRVFVLGSFSEPVDSVRTPDLWREALVINGKSWPHTERLSASQGDTVRWRIINAGDRPHPMHLHGFYFDVFAAGDAWTDGPLPPAYARTVVTRAMAPWSTMAMAFVPHTAGAWVFHCHILFHIESSGIEPRAEPSAHHGHDMDAMRGLVLALNVTPRAHVPAPVWAAARRLRLVIGESPRAYGDSAGIAVTLEDGTAPAPAPAMPAPTIVLVKDEPVEITVVNRLAETTAIHWHGIELESYFDGVAGLSGTPGRLAPAIAPGDSFVVRMAPPRAGTFIYHSHFNDISQISRGLYGALLVLEPGHRYDPATDLVLIHGQDPRLNEGDILLNGRAAWSEPLELRAGVRYRVRLIGLPAGPMRVISLLRGAAPASWRLLAKDGADVPASAAPPRPARQPVWVGETYDFEFTPQAGDSLRIEVLEPRTGRAPTFPVRVR
jgi:manganese oxidase